MIQGTTYVLPSEKALALYEYNLPSPLGGRRRFEIIMVVRDDKPSEYRREMGKVTEDDELRIPSLMEHTVDELRHMANQMRFSPIMDKMELAGVNKMVGQTGTKN